MFEIYTAKDVRDINKKLIDFLNKKYCLNVSINYNSNIDFSETYFDNNTNTINLGVKDKNLKTKTKNMQTYSLRESIEIFQFVLHEFFHGEQVPSILEEKENDILLFTDYILSEIIYDVYEENHTISLIEIDAESKSWNTLSELLPEILNVDKARVDFMLCSLYAEKDNEFFEKINPNILDKTFMKLPGATIEDLNSFIKQLETYSRKTLRTIPSSLSGYFEGNNIDTPIEQNISILKQIDNLATTNPILLSAKHSLKELKENHPKLLELLNIEKSPEPNIGGGRY